MATNATLVTTNPATEAQIACYPCLSASEVDTVITQAVAAQKLWQQTSWRQRRQCLLALADQLTAQQRACAQLITEEMGKPITASLAEIDKCIWLCQHYAEHGEAYLQEQIVQTEHPLSKVIYQPLGIILAIMPWNFPFWQVFRFLCPNLMAGNVGLLSHAEITTGCGDMIAQLVARVFPGKVFQHLHLNNQQTEQLLANQHVAAVTLTGSDRAGRAVASEAGKNLKKCLLELGGSDAYIVCPDADLADAAKQLMAARMNNTGQVCIAAKRIIIVDEVYEQFAQLCQTELVQWQYGDPVQVDCKMGPMARHDLRANVHQQVMTMVAQGATLALGGQIPDCVGFYYPATPLTNVTEAMLCFHEEVFGPVAMLVRARSNQDAIRLANATPFGLAAGVFTQDQAMIAEAIEQLAAGAVAINQCVGSDPRLPFGGIKQSGFGRELAAEGMREFVNIKTVTVA